MAIGKSVGRNAVNDQGDVTAIQQLLDANLHLLIPLDKLGAVDKDDPGQLAQLISRIETFQRRVQPRTVADGRVDPGGDTGDTLEQLEANAAVAARKRLAGKAELPLYPFLRLSVHDPETGARNFGANRSGGRRKHAGIDLKFPAGTPIRAMADGVVVAPPTLFYDGVKAFAVDHGIFIARYGEISRTAPGFDKVGAKVKRGEIIAFVGQLSSGNSMLHLELYSGVGGDPLTNPLTNPKLMPFQRRADLLNPMDFIKASTLNDAPGRDDHNARVGARVLTVLSVRDAAKLDAKVVAKLSPGSRLDVVDQVTGDTYPTDTGTSDVWFKVDIDGAQGFAAAHFIDRVSTASPGPEVTGPKIDILDAVGAFGRASSRVESSLNLREAADPSSTVSAKLDPGTLLEIKQKLTGKSYSADGSTRDDWLKVDVKEGPDKGKTGFVATFYVDPVLRTGQTSEAVTTGLVVHEQPEPDAVRVATLMPGTSFTVVRATTGGTYKDAAGADRRDWLDIEHDSKRGFVASAFVDLLDPADVAKDPNAILFTYEPTGASEKTARQDALPAQGIVGVKASEAMAQADRERVKRLKAKFVEAGEMFDLPPALLAAIASRETRCGAVLDHNGFGDRGNAFGIMQVDKRFHSPIETEDGPAGEAHIHQATQILRDNLDLVQRRVESLSDSQSLQMAVSQYNGGLRRLPPHSDEGTTGGDYMNDVWARARYYAKLETFP
jgi:hypothetical protein